MLTETKEVEVIAGGTTRVEFDLGAARVATK